MIFFAPAKINLGLKVLNRRSDHYHNIDTVFYPVPLYDIIEVMRNDSFSMQITGIQVDGLVEDNLLYKAWKLIHDQYSIPGVKIHLHKQIPMGAGLGGGSSDAATLIKAINSIFHLELTAETMKELSARLGADCPFFIDAIPIRALGIGDRFSPVSIDLSGYYLVLVKPAIHISTAEAYGGVFKEGANAVLFEDSFPEINSWKDVLVNSFEKHLFEKYSVLAQIKHQLYEMGAIFSLMSGSGATIYGIFEHEVEIPDKWNKYFVWQSKL